MTDIDEQGRPEPPSAGDEAATLRGFLDFQRATFEWKCAGLDGAGFRTSVASSTMTLGGMMKHLALVEESWFSRLRGKETGPPWNAVDWDSDPDWEWRTAMDDSPDQLRELWRESVESANTMIDDALGEGGLDQLAPESSAEGRSPSFRWILCHMIEEYARHNGHADLIREAVDGQTGE
jgi:uncharacterized damage-inducible protein DinB